MIKITITITREIREMVHPTFVIIFSLFRCSFGLRFNNKNFENPFSATQLEETQLSLGSHIELIRNSSYD